MKNLKCVLILLTLSATISLHAQSVYVGIKGGGSFSSISSNNFSNVNWKIGGIAGIAIDYEFISNMSVQTGLYGVMKGASYTADDEKLNGKLDARMYYIQIPLHFAYKIPLSGNTRFNVNAGPYFATGIVGKTTLTGSLLNSNAASLEFDTFTKAEGGKYAGLGYKRFDAGLGVGVGFEVGQFTFDFGWDFGMMNISWAENANVKNRSGYATIGYMF